MERGELPSMLGGDVSFNSCASDSEAAAEETGLLESLCTRTLSGARCLMLTGAATEGSATRTGGETTSWGPSPLLPLAEGAAAAAGSDLDVAGCTTEVDPADLAEGGAG